MYLEFMSKRMKYESKIIPNDFSLKITFYKRKRIENQEGLHSEVIVTVVKTYPQVTNKLKHIHSNKLHHQPSAIHLLVVVLSRATPLWIINSNIHKTITNVQVFFTPI